MIDVLVRGRYKDWRRGSILKNTEKSITDFIGAKMVVKFLRIDGIVLLGNDAG